MGGKRRKATGGPIKKASKYKIPSRFDCPVCDAKNSIAVRIFRSVGEAIVSCRTCKVGQERRWKILPLEKAVDVFFRFREELMRLDRNYVEAHQQPLIPPAAAAMMTATTTTTAAAPNAARHAAPVTAPPVKDLAGLTRVVEAQRAARTHAVQADKRPVRGGDEENTVGATESAYFFAPPPVELDEDSHTNGGVDDDDDDADDYAAMFE